MIVYSNTTPFIALASIDRLDLLPQLFGTVHVAEAVIAECAAGGRIVVPDLRGLEWIVPVADEQNASTLLSLIAQHCCHSQYHVSQTHRKKEKIMSGSSTH